MFSDHFCLINNMSLVHFSILLKENDLEALKENKL